MEKEKRYEELFKLMQEHPELPVVPMVWYEICADGSGYWVGSFGSARLDEYLVTDEKIVFKSDDDVFEALESYMPYDEFEKLSEKESECRPYYEALPWVKAIIAYIEMPD